MMRRLARQRGVSLIEAVVALGVMAFGMLALVGVQATLRSSGDLARQRTEAMRIAQETMESYRAYNALAGTAGALDFSEITTLSRTAFVPTGTALENRLNTTFYTTITAPTVTNTAAMKPVAVTVDWTDRSGEFQAVELRSLIAGVPPELSGSLALPPSRDPFAAPRGRHRSVPLTAFALPGTELSVFKPPRRTGGDVAWLFNNLTGLVTGLCSVDTSSTNASLAADANFIANLSGCTSVTAQVLSGYIRFAAGDPTVAEAESPNGGTLNLSVRLTLTSSGHPWPETSCYDDSTDDPTTAAARREVVYNCLVFSNTARTWAGRLRIVPRAFQSSSAWTIAASGATNFKVCRYTPLDSDTGSRNIDQPLDYTAAGSLPGAGLTNQNYLVIGADFSCPTETPTAGDPFNSNTRLHQNGVSPYTNP